MFSPTSEKRKSSRKRKSDGARTFEGISEADIVGCFPVQKVKGHVEIVEHKISRSEVVYSIDIENQDENIVEIGKEINCDDEACDFVVAVVDEETGETEYRPARFYEFVGRYTDDKKRELGIVEDNKDKKPNADDNNVKREEFNDRRTGLTDDFGSNIKRKQHDSSTKARIKEQVLDNMVHSIFSGPTNLIDPENIKMDDISLVKNAKSTILPPAVTDIKNISPLDIYPLSLFISEEEVAYLEDISKTLVTIGQEEHMKNGWPELIFFTCPDYMSHRGIKAVGFALLACQIYLFTLFKHQTEILKSDFDNMPFPQEIVSKVQADYLPPNFDTGSSKMANSRLILSPQQKDRLLAWTLALGLTMNPEVIIHIVPWSNVVHRPPNIIINMLKALGCIIGGCSDQESLRTNSFQVGRLVKPPQAKGITKRPKKNARK